MSNSVIFLYLASKHNNDAGWGPRCNAGEEGGSAGRGYECAGEAGKLVRTVMVCWCCRNDFFDRLCNNGRGGGNTDRENGERGGVCQSQILS